MEKTNAKGMVNKGNGGHYKWYAFMTDVYPSV